MIFSVSLGLALLYPVQRKKAVETNRMFEKTGIATGAQNASSAGRQENSSIFPVNTHTYTFRLWSNYGYGTENAFFGEYFLPKKAKGERYYEQQE